MITIHMQRDAQGRYNGYLVQGHAEFADAGTDIVCAAVSGITLTAALGLRDVLACPGTYENQPGTMHVALQVAATAETQAVLATMVAGLREIAAQYPDYLEITE